jgi:hypothetical protein
VDLHADGAILVCQERLLRRTVGGQLREHGIEERGSSGLMNKSGKRGDTRTLALVFVAGTKSTLSCSGVVT